MAAFALLGSCVTAVLTVVGGFFNARLHSRLGAVETKVTGFESRQDREVVARRESISLLERDQVESRARTEATLNSEREARRELETRMERDRQQSEARIMSAIHQNGARTEALSKELFDKLDHTNDKLGTLAVKFGELRGSIHPATQSEA